MAERSEAKKREASCQNNLNFDFWREASLRAFGFASPILARRRSLLISWLEATLNWKIWQIRWIFGCCRLLDFLRSGAHLVWTTLFWVGNSFSSQKRGFLPFARKSIWANWLVSLLLINSSIFKICLWAFFYNNIQARIIDLETALYLFFLFISLLQASKKCLNIGKKLFFSFCSFFELAQKSAPIWAQFVQRGQSARSRPWSNFWMGWQSHRPIWLALALLSRKWLIKTEFFLS